MGWHQIPDYDTSAASMDDNPFAGSRVKTTGKVSVKLLVDEWLCKKLEKLNVTFYCVNTSYPMDKCLSGRRRPARQTPEKDVLCFHQLAGPSTVHSLGGAWYLLPV